MNAQNPSGTSDRPDEDRRRPLDGGESPMATLRRLPALLVLERLPVPVMAVTGKDTIVFANEALATLLGYTQDSLRAMRWTDVLATAAVGECAVSVVTEHADSLVDLLHADGGKVRAIMSRSALQRAEDRIALVTFQDLSEQLWLEGR